MGILVYKKYVFKDFKVFFDAFKDRVNKKIDEDIKEALFDLELVEVILNAIDGSFIYDVSQDSKTLIIYEVC
jgi:hypothetical protein